MLPSVVMARARRLIYTWPSPAIYLAFAVLSLRLRVIRPPTRKVTVLRLLTQVLFERSAPLHADKGYDTVFSNRA